MYKILTKPVYTGMTILGNSKILMYDFFYNYLKRKYGPKREIIYTDTDSLLVDIQTEDVYKGSRLRGAQQISYAFDAKRRQRPRV